MFPISLTGDVVPKAYSNGPNVSIPVALLLDLHNAFPEGHQTRRLIVEYISAYADSNDNACWPRAVVRKADGSLAFDETLWDVAVYRAKQETRLNSSEKAFAELRSQLDLLGEFYESEKTLIPQLSPVGEPLLPMPAPSPVLQYVRQHAEALRVLVDDMHCGLANNIAGTTERAFLQKLEQAEVNENNKTPNDLP